MADTLTPFAQHVERMLAQQRLEPETMNIRGGRIFSRRGDRLFDFHGGGIQSGPPIRPIVRKMLGLDRDEDDEQKQPGEQEEAADDPPLAPRAPPGAGAAVAARQPQPTPTAVRLANREGRAAGRSPAALGAPQSTPDDFVPQATAAGSAVAAARAQSRSSAEGVRGTQTDLFGSKATAPKFIPRPVMLQQLAAARRAQAEPPSEGKQDPPARERSASPSSIPELIEADSDDYESDEFEEDDEIETVRRSLDAGMSDEFKDPKLSEAKDSRELHYYRWDKPNFTYLGSSKAKIAKDHGLSGSYAYFGRPNDNKFRHRSVLRVPHENRIIAAIHKNHKADFDEVVQYMREQYAKP